MILNTSTTAADAMLDSVARLMDAGAIEILTASQHLLVTLRLSDPSADPAVDGELQLNTISEAEAVGTGTASFARVVGPSGDEVFSADVGDFSSDAVIKLVPVLITKGAPVRLNSFRLVLP
jgi:hypothetical protein